jgi:hypothetical protein
MAKKHVKSKEPCRCKSLHQKRPFWWKWKQKETTYTVEQVAELVERIKEFNAGCIDAMLSKHTDQVFKEWIAGNSR